MPDYSSGVSGGTSQQPNIDETSVALFFATPHVPLMFPSTAECPAWPNSAGTGSFDQHTLDDHRTTIARPSTS
jgi:hypothetical protein